MVTKELLTYITKELQGNKKPEEITHVLAAEGWQEKDIKDAFMKVRFSSESPVKSSLRVLSNKNFLFAALGSVFILSLIIVGMIVSRVLPDNTKTNDTVNVTGTPALTVTFNPTESIHQSIVDCGRQDYTIDLSNKPKSKYPKLECFISSAKVCNSAKLAIDSTLDVYGIKTTNTVSYNIAKEKNACRLHLMQGNISYTLPYGVPEDMLSPILSVLKKLENTEGVCKFANNNDLAEVFEKLNRGDFSMQVPSSLQGQTKQNDMYIKGGCTGTYFDAVNAVNNPSGHL